MQDDLLGSLHVLVLDLGYDGEQILGAFATLDDAQGAAQQYMRKSRWHSPVVVYTLPLGELVSPDYLELHRTEICRSE